MAETSPQEHARFEQLLRRFLDGIATAEERAAFYELLRDHPERMADYAAHVELTALARCLAGTQAAGQMPAVAVRGGGSWVRRVAAAALLAACGGLAVWGWGHGRETGRRTTAVAQVPAPTRLAVADSLPREGTRSQAAASHAQEGSLFLIGPREAGETVSEPSAAERAVWTVLRSSIPTSWISTAVVRTGAPQKKEKKMKAKKNIAVLAAAALGASAPISMQAATTAVWTGGAASGNWSEAGNWGGTAPVSAADTALVFDGTTQLFTTNDVASPFLLSGITFNAGAGAFTLSGGALGLYGNIVNNSASAQTIGNDITLGANSQWTAAYGDLIFTGYLTGPTNNLSKMGASRLLFRNASANIGNLSVGAGTLVLDGGVFTNVWANKVTKFTGTGSHLVLTNGAKFVVGATAAGDYAQLDQNDCSITVAGNGTEWIHGTGLINFNKSRCLLTICDDALVTNVTRLFVGYGSSIAENTLSITNGGRMVLMASDSYLGKGSTSTSNRIVVAGADAAEQRATWDFGASALTIGSDGSSSNALSVSSGGQLLNTAFVVGGSDNAIVFEKGSRVLGRVTAAGSQQGKCTVGGSRNSVWVGGTDPVSGEPVFWSVEGTLTAGYGAGATDSRIVLTDHAVVTNVAGASGFGAGASGAGSNSLVTVSNGARVSATALNLGIGTLAFNNRVRIDGGFLDTASASYIGTGPGASENSVEITGNGVWMQTGSFFIGAPSDGSSSGARNRNQLRVSDGGCVTNASAQNFKIGHAIGSDGNSLVIDESAGGFYIKSNFWVGAGGNSNRLELGVGTIISTVDAYIGSGSSANTVYVHGAGQVQFGDNSYDDLYVGGSGGTANVLCVGTGGTVAVYGTLYVGDPTSAWNRVSMEGGTLTAGALSVASSNVLSYAFGAQGLEPMTVSGNATFEAGSRLSLSAPKDLPTGTYPILTAASISDNGLVLDPATDARSWSFSVSADKTTLNATYRPSSGTVVLLF